MDCCIVFDTDPMYSHCIILTNQRGASPSVRDYKRPHSRSPSPPPAPPPASPAASAAAHTGRGTRPVDWRSSGSPTAPTLTVGQQIDVRVSDLNERPQMHRVQTDMDTGKYIVMQHKDIHVYYEIDQFSI